MNLLGEVFASSDGKKYKVYRGMASIEAQRDWKGSPQLCRGGFYYDSLTKVALLILYL